MHPAPFAERSPKECVKTVILDLNHYIDELGICSECAIILVADKRKMSESDVRQVFVSNIDEVKV